MSKGDSKTPFSRFMSIVVSIALIISVMPVTVSAEDISHGITTVTPYDAVSADGSTQSSDSNMVIASPSQNSETTGETPTIATGVNSNSPSAANANADSSIQPQGDTIITPNKLTITWSDGRRAPVTIDTFRFYGYNVAQLRTMVAVLGGSVDFLGDNTYQIKAAGPDVPYTPIGFNELTDVKYILNYTKILNYLGGLAYANTPGWVYLPKYEYNWGSFRDV